MVAQPTMAKGILPPPQHASPQLYGTIVLGQWKDAFLFAWHGYGNAAFGYDELLPTSNGSIQNFNGWGVMLHDFLKTMLLMRLKNSEEYKHAMEHVAKQTFKDHVGRNRHKFANYNGGISFFKTTIRYLGGLLFACGLSGDLVLGKGQRA
ncbi:glycoside hydrolase [Cantharellus anzutake]|uniref:glycoside hydrolase n=1 Tax=Cantharellus anzutake TaxID=1750568 RepID=UPI0019090349|nr:glycoside hydrolase [Cantharellus anzutake]KAF8330916.1 glycoside hydrolase [Cantharellus anzutake]